MTSLPWKATVLTKPELVPNKRTWFPVVEFHSRAVPSEPTVTTADPSGLKDASWGMLFPGSWMYLKLVGGLVVASQMIVYPSASVVTIFLPSVLKATLLIWIP